MILVMPLVFIVASGEIDVSFQAVFGMGAWTFASGAQADLPLVLCLLFTFAIIALQTTQRAG